MDDIPLNKHKYSACSKIYSSYLLNLSYSISNFEGFLQDGINPQKLGLIRSGAECTKKA